jgi:hypothetical protein
MSDTGTVKLNFAGVPDQKSFAPAPPGIYTLRVMECKIDSVKNGENAGATMLKWTHEIVDEEPDSKVDGKKVFDNTVLTKKAYFRMKGLLKALGFTNLDDSEDADDLEFDPTTVIGDTFVAHLGVDPESKDPGTGRTYPAKNKITKFIVSGEEDDE